MSLKKSYVYNWNFVQLLHSSQIPWLVLCDISMAKQWAPGPRHQKGKVRVPLFQELLFAFDFHSENAKRIWSLHSTCTWKSVSLWSIRLEFACINHWLIMLQHMPSSNFDMSVCDWEQVALFINAGQMRNERRTKEKAINKKARIVTRTNWYSKGKDRYNQWS